MTYQSTKTFGHELGLSACFRQHAATHSHCSLLHGYALSFKFVFEADTLDDRNWVQDFGGLRELKRQLQATFDHKLVVAEDDPNLDAICSLNGTIADVLLLPAVGCEAFAKLAYDMAVQVIQNANNREFVAKRAKGLVWAESNRVRVVSCECAEHGANSAIYIGEKK
jgi:6-pyruvoyltetrahydropterin/6-carboxytetrahydropterin synthase